VFQLLIFFMLSLKIVSQEGNFEINMPLGRSPKVDNRQIQPIKVRLVAAPDGRLASLQIGGRKLGNDDRAFNALTSEIIKIVGRPGVNDDIEVQIDADFQLHYSYTIQAITACKGRLDPRTGREITYVKNIQFAPPRAPPE
jgi:biopolymer transport protein ExbD